MGHHLRLFEGMEQPSASHMPHAARPTDTAAAAFHDLGFGARLYVERLACRDAREPQVRVLLNEAVLPLAFCGSDRYGRCSVTRFVKGIIGGKAEPVEGKGASQDKSDAEGKSGPKNGAVVQTSRAESPKRLTHL